MSMHEKVSAQLPPPNLTAACPLKPGARRAQEMPCPKSVSYSTGKTIEVNENLKKD